MITEPTPGTFLDISIIRISVNANRNWYATDILQYSMLRIEIASAVQFTFHPEIKKKEEKRKLIRIYTSRFTFVSQSMYNISPLWLEVKRTECVKLTETQIRFSCWDESRYLSRVSLYRWSWNFMWSFDIDISESRAIYACE